MNFNPNYKSAINFKMAIIELGTIRRKPIFNMVLSKSKVR